MRRLTAALEWIGVGIGLLILGSCGFTSFLGISGKEPGAVDILLLSIGLSFILFLVGAIVYLKRKAPKLRRGLEWASAIVGLLFLGSCAVIAVGEETPWMVALVMGLIWTIFLVVGVRLVTHLGARAAARRRAAPEGTGE